MRITEKDPLAEIDDDFESLREAGFRLTAPRLSAARLFAGSNRWFTPQELHQFAGEQGIRVGLTTVYRLLEAMTSVSLARRFALSDERAYRYVYCHPGHHHHLICRECGRVEDVDDCRVQPPASRGFHVEGHVLDFFGLCGECHKRGATT